MTEPLEKSIFEAGTENTKILTASVNPFPETSLQYSPSEVVKSDNLLQEFEIFSLDVREVEGELLTVRNPTFLNDKPDFPAVQAVFAIRTKKGLKSGQLIYCFSKFPKMGQLSIGKKYRFKAAVNEHEDKLLLFYLPSRTIFVASNIKENLQYDH